MRGFVIVLLYLVPVSTMANAGDSGCVDTGVSGISLADGETVRSRLGDVADKGEWVNPAVWAVTVRSPDGNTLRLDRHPGASETLEFSWFVIAPGTETNANAITVEFSLVTSCGIKIGTKRSAVVDLLGPPSEVKKSGQTVGYVYELGQESGLVKRHNAWKYVATYEFRDNKVSRIEFGFPVP